MSIEWLVNSILSDAYGFIRVICGVKPQKRNDQLRSTVILPHVLHFLTAEDIIEFYEIEPDVFEK